MQILFEFTDGKKFYNPFFDKIQSVMIPVKILFCLFYVDIVFCGNFPGQFQQPVEVIAGNSILRRRRWYPLQSVQFFFRHFSCFRAQLSFCQFCFELNNLNVVLVFSQLFFDGIHLLAEKEFTLLFVNIIFGRFLDLLAHLCCFKPFIQVRCQPMQQVFQSGNFQNGLFILKREMQH